MKKIIFISLLSFFFIVSSVQAHPGRTDSYGCHTCRTNCFKWGLSTGEYHCHNAKALPQPEEPVTSHYSETGGYTEPAPEYKKEEATPIVPVVEEEVQQPVIAPASKQVKQQVAAENIEPETTTDEDLVEDKTATEDEDGNSLESENEENEEDKIEQVAQIVSNVEQNPDQEAPYNKTADKVLTWTILGGAALYGLKRLFL